MSNVIRVLERLGTDATLRHAPLADVERLLSEHDVDAETRSALLLGSKARLAELVGAAPTICCMIHAPDEEEEEHEGDTPAPDHDGDDDDNEPEPSKTGVRRARRL